MKKMLVRVMLISITTATSVSAGVLEPFSGLGTDRSALTLEQIEARSERLQESSNFSLLRFPEALQAPGRIFRPRQSGASSSGPRASTTSIRCCWRA